MGFPRNNRKTAKQKSARKKQKLVETNSTIFFCDFARRTASRANTVQYVVDASPCTMKLLTHNLTRGRLSKPIVRCFVVFTLCCRIPPNSKVHGKNKSFLKPIVLTSTSALLQHHRACRTVAKVSPKTRKPITRGTQKKLKGTNSTKF